jgi:hypothetical protein
MEVFCEMRTKIVVMVITFPLSLLKFENSKFKGFYLQNIQRIIFNLWVQLSRNIIKINVLLKK